MDETRKFYRAVALMAFFSLAVAVPQGMLAQTEKGIELYNHGEFDKAEKAFQEALKTNPSDLAANYYLGLSALFQKRQNEALALFMKVKQNRDKMEAKARPAAPSEYQIQLALARANLELRHFDEAWKRLESARKENAGGADVYVYRGAYYLEQEKQKEALKELEKAISIDDHNAYAYYYQGLAYFHSGQGLKAVDAFRKFLELAPYAPEAGEAKRLVDILC